MTSSKNHLAYRYLSLLTLIVMIVSIPSYTNIGRENYLAPKQEISEQLILSADEFEGILTNVLKIDLNETHHHRLELKINEHSYKVTIPRTERGEWYYFRVGELFIVNSLHHSIPRKSNEERDFLSRFKNVIWLTETDDLDKSWGWPNPDILDMDKISEEYRWLVEDTPPPPYLLPSIVSTLIAMQEIEHQIKGATVVDVGSRNGLYAIVALRLGAKQVILSENEVPDSETFFLNWPLQQEYDVQDKDDLIEANLKLNGAKDPSAVYRCDFIDIPPQKLEKGVVIFNFPEFGSPYRNSGRSAGSLIKDIFKLFSGVEVVIASGGDTTDEEAFLKDTELLPLQSLFEASIFTHFYIHKWGRLNRETEKWESGVERIKVYVKTFVFQVEENTNRKTEIGV